MLPSLPRPREAFQALAFLGALQLQLNPCQHAPAGKVCGEKHFWTHRQAQACARLSSLLASLAHQRCSGREEVGPPLTPPGLACPQRQGFVTAPQCHSAK